MTSLQQHKCPHCQQPTVWSGNPDRPFCSERCRLVDLGAWMDEGYRIPAGNSVADMDDDRESNT
jgi:hypothetical protein